MRDNFINGSLRDPPHGEFKDNTDTTFFNGDLIQPTFDFKSLPIDLKNKNLPFIIIGLFLLYRWCT